MMPRSWRPGEPGRGNQDAVVYYLPRTWTVVHNPPKRPASRETESLIDQELPEVGGLTV